MAACALESTVEIQMPKILEALFRILLIVFFESICASAARNQFAQSVSATKPNKHRQQHLKHTHNPKCAAPQSEAALSGPGCAQDAQRFFLEEGLSLLQRDKDRDARRSAGDYVISRDDISSVPADFLR